MWLHCMKMTIRKNGEIQKTRPEIPHIKSYGPFKRLKFYSIQNWKQLRVMSREIVWHSLCSKKKKRDKLA